MICTFSDRCSVANVSRVAGHSAARCTCVGVVSVICFLVGGEPGCIQIFLNSLCHVFFPDPGVSFCFLSGGPCLRVAEG